MSESANDWPDTAVDLETFRELAKARRSIRSFRDEPIPDDVLQDVLTAANWAPSGANAQPWEFVVVRDKHRRESISEIFKKEVEYKHETDPTFPAGGNVKEFREAPVTVVIAGDTRFDRWWPQILDGSREKLFQHSLAACVMNLHLAARAAGLGTTWVTCRPPSEHRLRDLLELPDYFRVGSVAPLGYPDPERNPTERSRTPVEYKIHEETLDHDRVPDTEDIMEGKDEWIDRVYYDGSGEFSG